MSASEAARAVEDAAAAGDTVQALYKTSIAASRAATARPQGLSDPAHQILGMHGSWAAVSCRSKAGGACPARLAACAVIKGKPFAAERIPASAWAMPCILPARSCTRRNALRRAPLVHAACLAHELSCN